MKIIVGTRGSKLAVTQTNWVINKLKEKHPEVEFETKIIKTKGDLIQNVSLDKIGDKGLFVKEIEQQLIDGQIDMAVHSMKDMPSNLPEGLKFASIPKREDARDVLVLKEGYSSINDLPNGAKVATGSKRRKYQLLKYRPDLNIVPIRGNVDTRIRKIVDENLDGVVLAASGLLRVGLEDKITYYIPKDIMIPAPAQGARHPLTLAGGCAPGQPDLYAAEKPCPEVADAPAGAHPVRCSGIRARYSANVRGAGAACLHPCRVPHRIGQPPPPDAG